MTAVLVASDTASRILDVAERLVQTRGFNAFSYADIAAELNITKAALHYHFPAKAMLGERLVERYQENFLGALARIDDEFANAGAEIRAYVEIYTAVLEQGRMCLCGMMAADYATLPPGLQDLVRRFFDENETWVTETLTYGRAHGQLTFDGTPVDTARFVVGALEGAMLMARLQGNIGRFRTAAARVVSGLGAA